MNRIVFTLGIIFLLLSSLSAQSKLEKQIKNLANDPALQYGQLSVCVIDVASGKTIASHEAKRSLIPASSLKVVTTATAIGLLGANFRFKTQLEYDGTITAGELNGNLYLKGFGDPSLASDHYDGAMDMKTLLQTITAVVAKKGIQRIRGAIVGDASFYPTAVNGRSWLWEDIGNYYAAGAWGLNFHENRYFLHFQQTSKLGASPKIKSVEPAVPNLLLLNEIIAAAKGTGDNAYLYGSPLSYTRFVRGTIPIGTGTFTIKGAIPDPPFFAAYHLMNSLENAGIQTEKLATTQFERTRQGLPTAKRQILYTHQSPPLSELVEETNLKSLNLYCESFLRSMGKKAGKEASAEAGLAAIYDFWKARGLKLDGCFLEDGSGLSVRNAVSSYHLASIMRKIAKDDQLFTPIYASLPRAGETGSLKYILKGTAAVKKLRAKSGGMKRVRSYTGYAKTKSGKLLAFSMIANNFTGESAHVRSLMAKVMAAMCEEK